MIQGLYILRQDEGEINASKAGKTDKTEKRQPDSKTQTSKNSRKNNREFTVITYAVLVLLSA